MKQEESIQVLLGRFLTYLTLSGIFILLGLSVGIIGYHWTVGLSWVDSLVEASMILSGMGPISNLPTTSAKIFASLYALFSGLVFVFWIWYIFPQLDSLGYSEKAKYYGIKSLEEAREYLEHPILGTRLRECTEAVLAVSNKGISEILGHPDDLKLKSCMTLFASVANEPNSVFLQVLEKYYNGQQDLRTIELLK
jgi:uncharacterized protein (DUF1810 family)